VAGPVAQAGPIGPELPLLTESHRLFAPRGRAATNTGLSERVVRLGLWIALELLRHAQVLLERWEKLVDQRDGVGILELRTGTGEPGDGLPVCLEGAFTSGAYPSASTPALRSCTHPLPERR